jgi:hypothetical protein
MMVEMERKIAYPNGILSSDNLARYFRPAAEDSFLYLCHFGELTISYVNNLAQFIIPYGVSMGEV